MPDGQDYTYLSHSGIEQVDFLAEITCLFLFFYFIASGHALIYCALYQDSRDEDVHLQ